MSSYLVDVVCSFTPFPLMNWNFSSSPSLIHTYCFILWVVRFMDCFYHIYNNFLVPSHTLLFAYPPTKFSESTVPSLKETVD